MLICLAPTPHFHLLHSTHVIQMGRATSMMRLATPLIAAGALPHQRLWDRSESDRSQNTQSVGIRGTSPKPRVVSGGVEDKRLARKMADSNNGLKSDTLGGGSALTWGLCGASLVFAPL